MGLGLYGPMESGQRTAIQKYIEPNRNRDKLKFVYNPFGLIIFKFI